MKWLMAEYDSDKHHWPSFLRFRKSHGRPDPAAPPVKPFDEVLKFRLKSLPVPPSPVSLSWLCLAVDVLFRTISDEAALAADPDLPASDPAALTSHLDASIPLLDACNAITVLLDRLLLRRLHLRFANHLLASSPSKPGTITRAREAIKEWEESPMPQHATRASPADLIRKLRPGDPPRGKLSAVRRAIYAVEAVSSLVVTAILAVVGDAERADLAGIRAPGEFPWAEAFNELATEVANISGPAAEVVAAEARARELAAAIDGEDDDEKAERIRSALALTEKATEELTEGVDRLSNAVNRVFRLGLSTRNSVLQSFRTGPKDYK